MDAKIIIHPNTILIVNISWKIITDKIVPNRDSVDKISATIGIISVTIIFNCIPTIPIVDNILINVFATMIDKEYMLLKFNFKVSLLLR